MKYYLVNSSWNWADEISFSGFNIFDEKQFNLVKGYLENLVKEGDEIRCGEVGSNEDQDIRPSKVLDDFKHVIEITEAEYNALYKANSGKTRFDIFMNEDDFDKLEGQ